MEKKNNKGLIVTVVILVLLVLGLGGYIVYEKLIKEDTNQKQISQLQAEIQKLKQNEIKTENVNDQIDCSQIIKGAYYEVEGSAYDMSASGGPVVEATSMLFYDNSVHRVAGTAGWQDNYSINGNVITFGDSGAESYGIISQDCNTIYTIDPAVSIYQKKELNN